MTPRSRLVVVHPDGQILAQAVAARLLTRILDLQSVRSPVHVVLTGGTVGIKALAAVAQNPVRNAIDWAGVHLWWGDERFLPAGDADRNETQAREALLNHLSTLPACNIHAMPAADGTIDVDSAAAAYAQELASYAPSGQRAPIFDVTLLGMGPDGHVASLFPGHPALTVRGQATVGVRNSPKPPPERVSLTFDALRSSVEVWIVAAGAEKAAAVAAGLSGHDVNAVPAAGAVGDQVTLWLLDSAAAGTSPTEVC